MRNFHRLFAIIIGMILVSSTSSQQQECEVGDDGSCISSITTTTATTDTTATTATTTTTDGVSCMDDHEKCELWMTKGTTM